MGRYKGLRGGLWNVEPVHDVDELLEVLSLLYERHANVLDGRVQLQQELGILDVFGGQSCAVNLNVWNVDTLAGLEFSTTDDLHFQLRVAELLHDIYLHDAIFQQQIYSHLGGGNQGILLCGRLHGNTSGPDVVVVILADTELQHLAVDKLDWVSSQFSDTEFRTLEIAEALNLCHSHSAYHIPFGLAPTL